MSTSRLGIASTLAAVGEDPATAPTVVGAGADLTTAAGEASATTAAERYRPIGVLGEGGMGVVEEIWDNDLMRALALKRLRPELRRDSKLLGQFLWEARIGAHLDHPNIVPVHDLGMSPTGDLYFTMKRVRGQSLESVVHRLRHGDPSTTAEMTLSKRLRIFLSICEAIAFAHSRGVLHRDLKPANVMLGEHGEVFIMDWGIAVPSPEGAPEMLLRALPEGVGHGVSGTPQYMSPEQAAGRPVDVRSDVYTLGAILYELASLAPPISGDSVTDVLDKARQGAIRPLRQVMPEVSTSLRAVIDHALERDPERRYATVRDLARDVEVVLDGRTPSAEHAHVIRRLGRYWTTTDRARLRPMDLDFLIGSGIAGGVALGIWFADRLEGLGWAFLLLALVIGTPPFVQWFRATRRDR